MTFITNYTVTYVNYFIHTTQLYSVKEIKENTYLAVDTQVHYKSFTCMWVVI